jgi:uncharacterized membrane protein
MRVGPSRGLALGVLLVTSFATSWTAQTLCPDGSFVGSGLCQISPDGSFVGGEGTLVTFPRNSCPGRMLRFVAGWEEGKADEAQATQRRADHLQAA